MADDEFDEESEGSVPRSHIRQLEEQAKRAKDLEAQVVQLQRENVFTKALGGTSHPGVRYFQQGYDGPLEVDAIRTAATEAGFISTSEESAAQPTPGPDPALVNQFNAASQGASAAGRQSWQEALVEADRIADETEREAAILSVVERFGGVTSRTAQ